MAVPGSGAAPWVRFLHLFCTTVQNILRLCFSSAVQIAEIVEFYGEVWYDKKVKVCIAANLLFTNRLCWFFINNAIMLL